MDFQSIALPTELSGHSDDTRSLANHLSMGGGGFEPPKQVAADLQSVPFGHSGIHPYSILIELLAFQRSR